MNDHSIAFLQAMVSQRGAQSRGIAHQDQDKLRILAKNLNDSWHHHDRAMIAAHGIQCDSQWLFHTRTLLRRPAQVGILSQSSSLLGSTCRPR